MASAIARKLNHLPNLCKRIRLFSHFGTLGQQCRRSRITSPSIILGLYLPTLPLIPPVLPFGLGIQRYLLTTNSNIATTVEPEKPVSKSDLKSDSEGPEKSGLSNQGKSDGGKPVRGGPVSWLSFLLLVLTGAGILWYYDREKKRHIEEISNASQAVKQGPSAGKAAIGGPFNLVNHDGN